MHLKPRNSHFLSILMWYCKNDKGYFFGFLGEYLNFIDEFVVTLCLLFKNYVCITYIKNIRQQNQTICWT